jgi:NAD(P)H-hydrate epimerase
VDVDAVSQLGLPSLLLMENAARGVCEAVRAHERSRSITIVCGPGNNGGDGLAVARLLAAESMESTVILVRGSKTLSQDAADNLRFLQNCGIQVLDANAETAAEHLSMLTPNDFVIDALLGTGIRGRVQSPFAEVIQAINASSAFVLAVDVPSGLDCDSGVPCGVCVQAHRTVTFVATKSGFQQESALAFIGVLTVCHIGIPQKWLHDWWIRMNQIPR